MPDITVITPVYNTQDYLERCIKSIASQKGVSLQYIIIDDGSTDNSAYISRYHQSLDPRIVFISKANQGQGIARNMGIKLADSEYTYFVDSDDYLAPNCLMSLYESAKSCELDICSPGVPAHYFDKPLEIVGCLPCKSQFIRTSILKEFQILQPSVSSGQDGVFSHLVLTHCTRIGMDSSAIYHYTHARDGSTFRKHLARPDLVASILEQHFAAIEEHYDQYDLWASNYLRLLSFINDETFCNRLSPHLASLTDDERGKCFAILARVADKCLKFIDSEKVLNLPTGIRFLIDHNSSGLFNHFGTSEYKEKFSLDASNNTKKSSVSIVKFSKTHETLLAKLDSNKPSAQKASSLDSSNKAKECQNAPDFNQASDQYKRIAGKIDLAINTINNATIQIISAGNSRPNRLHSGSSLGIIVSLTTLPHRLGLVHFAIESILAQTVLPDKILLWLPNDDGVCLDSYPKLGELIERGVEIRRVKDLGPHTKLIYSLNEFPKEKIVTIDDDIIYPTNMLACLLERHKKYPESIVANWARELRFNHQGLVMGIREGQLLTPPSLEINVEQDHKSDIKPSLLAFAYGTSGVLYPPNCFAPEVFDLEKMRRLCPKEDDIWFKATSLLKGTKVAVTSLGLNPGHHCITGSQIDALRHYNHGEKRNESQMRAVFDFFGLYQVIRKWDQ